VERAARFQKERQRRGLDRWIGRRCFAPVHSNTRAEEEDGHGFGGSGSKRRGGWVAVEENKVVGQTVTDFVGSDLLSRLSHSVGFDRVDLLWNSYFIAGCRI
jgi:hypothetical protein